MDMNKHSLNTVTLDDAYLFLLTIRYGEKALKLVNNTEMVIRGKGDTYLPYPFKITLADDDAEKLPTLQLEIDNVDKLLIEAIRGLEEPPTMKLELVLASNPKVVELAIDHLILRSIQYNAMSITGTLEVQNTLTRRFPYDDILADQYSAAFY
jgi:hypothetical protein